jgi:hypothetical protein
MSMKPSGRHRELPMKNKRTVLVLFASVLGVVVACGGSSSSDVFGAGSDDGGGSGADAMTNPSGSDAMVDGASEGGGKDGGGTNDAATDAATDAAVDAGNLCASTGGTESTLLCCKSSGDFPDTCKIGACGCSPGNSRPVQSCLCPVNDCYDAVLGCRPR